MDRKLQVALGGVFAIVLVSIFQMTSIHLMPRPVVRVVPEPDIAASTQAYGAAVDRFLAAGDDQSLRDLIGVDFTNWTAGNTIPTAYDALHTQLDSARTLFPGLTLDHNLLHSVDGIATVQVSPSTTGSVSFAGMAVAPGEWLGDREILRFERGRLVERWSFPSIQGTFTTLAATPAGNPGFATLSRFSVLDGVSTDTSLGASNAALIVEQGAIRLGIDQIGAQAGALWLPSGEHISLDTQVTRDLPAGSAVYLPAGVLSHVWAPPGQRGSVLVVSLQVVVATGNRLAQRVDLPIGVPTGPRGSIALDGRRITLQTGRMHLAPGSTFGLAEAGATLVLLGSGSLDVESSDQPRAALAPGQSILSKPGASLTFRVTSTEGADIDFLTFAPA